MVGSVPIGGGAPVSVQSMTNTDTRDADATIKQIRRLEAVRVDIVRVAVPDREAAHALARFREAVDVPLVADIHFNHELALLSIEAGVDKLRITQEHRLSQQGSEIVSAAKDRGIPIRIGANSGSVRRDSSTNTAAQLHKRLLERTGTRRDTGVSGFHDIVISIKSSDVSTATEAYELIASKVDYPLHVGITEAGGLWFVR